jgi:hypothetical protein
MITAAAVALLPVGAAPAEPAALTDAQALDIARRFATANHPYVALDREPVRAWRKEDAWVVTFTQFGGTWAGMLTVVIDQSDSSVLIAFPQPFDKPGSLLPPAER